MPTLEVNFSDLIRRAADQRGEQTAAARPMMAAQRIELMRRHAQYNRKYSFKPGELVMEKEGLSSFEARFRPMLALIFWRMIDFSNFCDRRIVSRFLDSHLAFDRVNCIIGRLSDDTDTILFMPHDTRNLRPLSEVELAELDPFLRDEGSDELLHSAVSL